MQTRWLTEFWNRKRVLVTGGHGFLGSHLLPQLERLGAKVYSPPRTELDLRDFGETLRSFEHFSPEVVIHLAAVQGGVVFINQAPASLYLENTQLNTHVIEASRLTGVKRVICMGSSCAYPDLHDVDLREEQLWDGPMHTSVSHYGLTKKAMILQLEASRRQSGLQGIVLVPSSLIGPGDDFEQESSHVAGALLRRFIEATAKGADKVILWGTGNPIREFMYVGDCVDAVLSAGAAESLVPLLNIGSSQGISIRDLATLIARLTNYQGQIDWDTNRPDGSPRKVLDSSKARAMLEWAPETSLEQALSVTLEWYRTQVQRTGPSRDRCIEAQDAQSGANI